MLIKTSQADHCAGHSVHDLNKLQKISYAKHLPIRYADIKFPYVSEESVETINMHLDTMPNAEKKDVTLQTYYTPDLAKMYGYFLHGVFDYDYAKTYYDLSKFSALSYFEKTNVDMKYYGAYISANGKDRFYNFGIKTTDLEIAEPFQHLEKFEDIRKCSLESNMSCAFRYCFDVENPEQLSIFVKDNMRPTLTLTDVFRKKTAEHYRKEKVDYYQKYVEKNILTQEQVDYILEASPRMQPSFLKFLWIDGKITNVELDSLCVHEFEQL